MRPSFEEIKRLYGNQPLVGVEIGVFLAENSINVISGLNLSKYYLVDPYLAYGQLNQSQQDYNKSLAYNSLKNTSCVEYIYKESEEAKNQFEDESIDFAYIDAEHSYEAVWQDILSWYPKVKCGGVLCGHDFDSREYNYGVMRAVTLWATQNFKRVVVDNSDWWVVK